MDRCPRDKSASGSIGQVARERLGKHYAFQSAQRLKLNFYEEMARRSNGAFWLLKLDVMDHSCTKIPTVWAQSVAQSKFRMVDFHI